MRRSFYIGLVAVALVAAGSVLMALFVRDNEIDHFHALQRDAALRSARQAEAVAQLSVGELATAAAFFQAQEDLNREDFDVVGTSLLRRGALTAAAYIEQVRDPERRAYERRHGVSIFERGALGSPQPASVRPVYYPVTYAVAEQQAKSPFGYDLASDPERGPFLRVARDSGRPAATSVMPLLIGGAGINVYRPIFRNGAPIATVAQRRAALIGFAAGAFRVKDLAAAAISTLPEEVDVQLRSGEDVVVGPDGDLADAAQAPITIADRTWLLVVRDPGRPGVSLPLLMAVFGISLAALLGALVLIWSRSERMRELQREASQDPLTGLKNRRRFEEDLRRELARSRRDGTSGALMTLDLDNFKQVNDTLGHPIGDRVIEEIAGVLGGRTRETDVLARIGGDEFAIVLPNCDEEEAQQVGETIATAVREHVPQPPEVPQITVSVGIAMFGVGTEAGIESLIAEADTAMYAAKASGRDGVRLAGWLGGPREED
jgi:diguanylate cyclase (GGDEF)-like protein